MISMENDVLVPRVGFHGRCFYLILFGDTSDNPALVGILEEHDNNEPTNPMHESL